MSQWKRSTCNAGDMGSIPGSGRSLEEGMATHSSILAWKNPMNRRAWLATVYGIAKSQTQMNNQTHMHGGTQRESIFYVLLQDQTQSKHLVNRFYKYGHLFDTLQPNNYNNNYITDYHMHHKTMRSCPLRKENQEENDSVEEREPQAV